MIDNIIDIPTPDPQKINHEKKKAQSIKKSIWWKNQLAKNKCYYCKARFHPSKLTMDHKISLARGGTSSKKNLAVCCQSCNKKKKHFFYDELVFNEKKIL